MAAYASWWPGATPANDTEVGLPLGRRTLDARASGHRDGVGLWLELPAYDGSLEWLLVPHDDGTIVNAHTDVDLPGGHRSASRALLRIRAGVRSALVGLKRSLEPS